MEKVIAMVRRNQPKIPLENSPGPAVPETLQITHRAIARACGVDQSTVSRALAGSPQIAPATAEAIRQTAVRMGYRPDPVLARLAAARCHRESAWPSVVAFITPTSEVGRLPGEYVEKMNGIGERAGQLGYRVEVFFRDRYPNVRSLERVLVARAYAG